MMGMIVPTVPFGSNPPAAFVKIVMVAPKSFMIRIGKMTVSIEKPS
jgi:hypothetical protein